MKNFEIFNSKVKMMAMSIIFTGSLISCEVPSAEQVLAAPEQRQEVMQQIASSPEMAAEMIDTLMNHEAGRQMMAGNQQLMRQMMQDREAMNQMMQNNPELRNDMMNSMMNDRQMMGNMMQMMNQRGMMSDECLQSSMGMMNGNGMMMDRDSMMPGDQNHMGGK